MHFLVHMYYKHPGYQTSISGINGAYYIQIFTVLAAIDANNSYRGIVISRNKAMSSAYTTSVNPAVSISIRELADIRCEIQQCMHKTCKQLINLLTNL